MDQSSVSHPAILIDIAQRCFLILSFLDHLPPLREMMLGMLQYIAHKLQQAGKVPPMVLANLWFNQPLYVRPVPPHPPVTIFQFLLDMVGLFALLLCINHPLTVYNVSWSGLETSDSCTSIADTDRFNEQLSNANFIEFRRREGEPSRRQSPCCCGLYLVSETSSVSSSTYALLISILFRNWLISRRLQMIQGLHFDINQLQIQLKPYTLSSSLRLITLKVQ